MFNTITDDELYKLMDILSINDICAIMAGRSPSDVYSNYYDGELYYTMSNMSEQEKKIFYTLLDVLKRAVTFGEIKANIVVKMDAEYYLTKNDLSKNWLAISEIDTAKTTIKKSDLKAWFESKGVYPSVFFPNGRKDDYMNPKHEAYSPTLAICVRAWEVAQTADYPNQTPKQFMQEWIQANAEAYGLLEDDNSVIGAKKAKELASISNWAKTGGAVKGNPLKRKQPTPLFYENQNISQELQVILPEYVEKNDDDLPF